MIKLYTCLMNNGIYIKDGYKEDEYMSNRQARNLAKNIIRGKNRRIDTLAYSLPVIKKAYNKLVSWGYIKEDNYAK